MTFRRNLVPNPALSVDGTGWSGNSGARATGASGLPRSTTYQWTGTTSDVITPQVAVAEGAAYRGSFSVLPAGTGTGKISMRWYNSAGTLLLSQPTSITLTSGAAIRFETPLLTAPTGAVTARCTLNNPSVGGQITALMVEQDGVSGADYFDGDTAGASWEGTAGAAVSAIRSIDDTVGASDSFGVVVSATAGPSPASDTADSTDAFTIASSAYPSELVAAVDSFLIASLAYDAVQGRIRVDAFTFAAAVVRVRVSRQPVTGGGWTVVRGGEVDAVAGRLARPVDDYEFPLGVDVDYRVEGLAADGTVRQTATVRRTAVGDRPWLKVAGNPSLNRELILLDWAPLARKSRTGLFDVINRTDPVVVSDVHSSRRTTLTLAAHTPQDRDALDAALSRGVPMLLQVPPDIALPSMWVSVGDYSMDKPTHRSQRSIFSVPVTEVSPPPSSAFVGSYLTWQSVADTYPTWEALAAAVGSWAELS